MDETLKKMIAGIEWDINYHAEKLEESKKRLEILKQLEVKDEKTKH